MALALDQRVKGQSKVAYVTLELCPSLTRGQCVVDWKGKLGKEPNVEIVTSVGSEDLYLELVKRAVQ